jgi:hypothetical protein
MNCSYNTCFKSVNSISEDLLLNILESNFKMFFDWSFLKIGAWFDATIPNSSTIYGSINPPSQLLLVHDPSYTLGQVWQGIRKEWVWETGVSYSGNSPINISGCYVNTNFVPYSGNGSYYIDYPDGRLIFSSAQPTSAKINVNHSYRYVQTYRSSDSPWFNKIQYPSLNNSNADIEQLGNGEWSIAGSHRIQLPAIIIESSPRSRSRPYELGNNNLWLEQDISFYVLAENKNDRNKILDILRLQQDLTINLYDTNKLAQDDLFPLDYNGNKKNNPLMYPNIVNNYLWRKCFVKTVNLFELDSVTPNLFQGLAKATLEVISD